LLIAAAAARVNLGAESTVTGMFSVLYRYRFLKPLFSVV